MKASKVPCASSRVLAVRAELFGEWSVSLAYARTRAWLDSVP